MRVFFVTAAVSLWSGFVALDARGDSRPVFHQPVQPPRDVQIVAHRGLRMLAPGNSIEAVRECAVDFIEWAEIDIRRTTDGRHVVAPNDSAGNPIAVADLTLEQVRGMNTGEDFAERFRDVRPVTLTQLIAAVGHDVNLVLRCDGVDPRLLVREIRDTDMQSRVLVSGTREFLRQVHGAADDVPLLAAWSPTDHSIDALVSDVHPSAIELPVGDLTPECTQDVQQRGLWIIANAVDEAPDTQESWIRALDCGVNAILTGNPAGVRFAEVRRRIPEFPVEIACHRGANRYAPENTLPAIELAAAFGSDYIEIDIRTTGDGECLLLHDRLLDRTTSGTGSVNEQTAAAVAALDAGAWFGAAFAGLHVPTFDEGLAALGERSHAYVDAKDIAPEAVVAAIRRHHLQSRHVVYQSVDYGRRLKALDPAVRLLPPLKSLDDLAAVAELHPYGVDASWSILSAALIDRCHQHGIRVFSDALGPHETLTDYRRAIGWGIDVIQTDYPLRVLRAIELEAVAKDGKNTR